MNLYFHLLQSTSITNNMKILLISNHHRHELGCASALIYKGHDVHYLAQDSTPSLILSNNRNIIVENELGKCNVRLVPNVPSEYCSQKYDLVISTPGKPWLVARKISKQQKIPSILRLWGFKALRLDYSIKYRDFYNISLSMPSYFFTSIEINQARQVVTFEHRTNSFVSKYFPQAKSKLSLIYPNFATVEQQNESNIDDRTWTELLDAKYVLCVVNIVRFHMTRYDKIMLTIIFDCAIKNPKLKFVIVGTTKNDIENILATTPSNIIFLGKIFSDHILKLLYQHSWLVLVPIIYRGNISNRFLEALFYGKPILTNDEPSNLFAEIKNNINVLSHHNYSQFPNMISRIMDNPTILNNISIEAKKVYLEKFSTKSVAESMEKLIMKVIEN